MDYPDKPLFHQQEGSKLDADSVQQGGQISTPIDRNVIALE
jgi:hypothetical protein